MRQRHGLIVKGKRISCPPHYAPPNNDYDPPHHDYELGFPLIRSLRASAQRSTSVLFSFMLSLLIVAGSFAIRQSKTIPWRTGNQIDAAMIFAPLENLSLSKFLRTRFMDWKLWCSGQVPTAISRYALLPGMSSSAFHSRASIHLRALRSYRLCELR